MSRWDSIRDVLKYRYIVGQKDITPVQAEKYRGDIYGLFRNELNIVHEYVYPHMIVNGYLSPYDYGGEILTFDIIDIDALRTYYSLFIKN